MTTRSGRSGNNNNNNNNNNGGAFDQLAQTLADLVGNQQPRQPSIVSEFKRLNLPRFDGATDPALVEKWVQEMEKAFELLGSNDEQKVTLAVYQLQGSAFDWWLMEKRKNETNAEENQELYSWEIFKKGLNGLVYGLKLAKRRRSYGSRRMTGDKALLSQFEEMAGPLVTFGDNNKGFTMGYGNLVSGNVVIEDVALVAGLEVQWVEFMHYKDETPHVIIEHIKKIEKQAEDQNCVKRLRSDNGTEFKNVTLNEFCKDKGIVQEFSIARIP
ncbi:hypothetical protein AgCh_020970 [Apium graveolens]